MPIFFDQLVFNDWIDFAYIGALFPRKIMQQTFLQQYRLFFPASRLQMES